MKSRILYHLIGIVLLVVVQNTFVVAVTCPYQVLSAPFTCGAGLPCAYRQYYSYCGLGGCRDCIDDCGAGQCTCGTDTYTTACQSPCTGPSGRLKSVTDHSEVAVAVPDCRGVYRHPGTPKRVVDIDTLLRLDR